MSATASLGRCMQRTSKPRYGLPPVAPQDGGGREGCQRGFRPRCRRRVLRSAVLRPNDRQALLVGHDVLRSCFRQARTYAAPSLSAALARRHNRFNSLIARALNHPSIRRELASFAPSGSAFSDSTHCELILCVDSKLASFGAFCGVFTLAGLCSGPSPWHTPSAASVPSCDKIPILSFVESSRTRWESYPTSGPALPLSSARSLCSSSHRSSAIWHSSSAICPSPSALFHPPSALRHPPFLLPHSAFRIPHSAFSTASPASAAAPASWPTGNAAAARTRRSNPAPRGRPSRRPPTASLASLAASSSLRPSTWLSMIA